MSPTAALLALSWIAIAILAFGLAACLRVIRFHDAMLNRAIGEPRRIAPGDSLQIPSGLRDLVSDLPTVILFGRAGCRSCVRAAEILEASDLTKTGDMVVLELWATDSPMADLAPAGTVRLDNQQPVLEEMRVGLLPYAILLKSDRVLASGAVGSTTLVHDFLKGVREHQGSGVARDFHPRERSTRL